MFVHMFRLIYSFTNREIDRLSKLKKGIVAGRRIAAPLDKAIVVRGFYFKNVKLNLIKLPKKKVRCELHMIYFNFFFPA